MRLKGKLFAIVPTLILIVFKNFAIVTILFQIISGAEKAKTQSPTHSLTLQRILSEFNEICSQGISFDTPFNSSRDECGIRLSPLRRNLLEWHFSFTGIEGSPFEGGVYHGKVRLHHEYPRKAPRICISTPSGRWEVDKDICLSASAHHQEMWNPNWNLRTLILSLRNFMPTQPREIGSISTAVDEQRKLATASRKWTCPLCGVRHSRVIGEDGEPGRAAVSSRLLSFSSSPSAMLLLRKQSKAASLSSASTRPGTAKGGAQGVTTTIRARRKFRGVILCILVSCSLIVFKAFSAFLLSAS